MEDLFRWADKYAMLKDDVWASFQQILVMNWLAKNNKAESSKPLNNRFRQGGWKQDGWQQQPLRVTPLTVSYERFLPLIRELLKFKWPKPIKTDPTRRRDWKQWCSYHKEHGNTMDQCKNLHYLIKKLIKVRHLKQYVCTSDGWDETKGTEWALMSLTVPRVIINYIHNGPVDDKYQPRK